MLTLPMTLIGMIVFLISIFTVGFKTAFGRLIGLIVAGLIFDLVLAATVIFGVMITH